MSTYHIYISDNICIHTYYTILHNLYVTTITSLRTCFMASSLHNVNLHLLLLLAVSSRC